MAAEDEKALVRRFEACYNRGDRESLIELLDADVVGYDPSIPEPLRGRNAVISWFEKGHAIFPDLRMEPVRTTCDGELIAVEYVETGTHKGAFPGPGGRKVGPTNKSFSHRMCIVYRVEKSRIVEFRLYWDVLGVMAQLGLGG